MREHVAPGRIHTHWDATLEPVLEIQSGDVVAFALPDVSHGQIMPRSTHEDLLRLNDDYALVGPVFVHDARPGDALEVEMLDLRPGAWGWTGIIPGFGLLSEQFSAPYLHIWDLSLKGRTRFLDVMEIPLQPFCGTMGVSPKTVQRMPVMPPGHFGGNMDIKSLGAGSSLWLPVQVDGALFSIGDPHAAQGNGEVAGTAIECSMDAAIRMTLHKDVQLLRPHFVSNPQELFPSARRFSSVGIASDLMEAAQDALRGTVAFLANRYNITPVQAYVLSSVIVDLAITEVVNIPNWTVTATVPVI